MNLNALTRSYKATDGDFTESGMVEASPGKFLAYQVSPTCVIMGIPSRPIEEAIVIDRGTALALTAILLSMTAQDKIPKVTPFEKKIGQS